MKKITLIFIGFILFGIGTAQAFEPRMRSVWFHDSSKDARTLSVMGCTEGFYKINGDNGKTLAEFMQPCASVGLKTDGTEGVRATFGIGIVEVMSLFSFNVGMLPDGALMYGTGISLKFNDSMTLFE